MAKKQDEKDELAPDQAYTQAYLKENKDVHLNFEEDRGDYKISTGSLIWDTFIDGGFDSGLVRFTGNSGGGKTSEALVVANNFVDTVEDSKIIFVAAEGRLSENMKKRTSLKFVYSAEEWVTGTCFVFECNVYETIFDWLRGLIKVAGDVRYCIILDSMDAFIPKGDLDKGSGEAPKVAGGAVLSADFLKRTHMGLAKRGHLCIMMSQDRAFIKASQYTPSDKNRMGKASGGNAPIHFSNWTIDFSRHGANDIIKEDEGAPISSTNPSLGHNSKIKILKSDNETEWLEITYPIKHGRAGKSAIWREREVIELLLQWEYIEKKGSWFSFGEELAEKVGAFKVQGMEGIYKYIEENEDVFAGCMEFAKQNILS